MRFYSTNNERRVNVKYESPRNYTILEGWSIPQVGDLIDGNEIIDVRVVNTDMTQINDEIRKYEYFVLTTADFTGDEIEVFVGVEKTETLADYIENMLANYDIEDVEVYGYKTKDRNIHSDNIESVYDAVLNKIIVDDDGQIENRELIDYEEMDEEDYNNTILANTSETADFDSWYDNKDGKVMVVVLSKKIIDMYRACNVG